MPQNISSIASLKNFWRRSHAAWERAGQGRRCKKEKRRKKEQQQQAVAAIPGVVGAKRSRNQRPYIHSHIRTAKIATALGRTQLLSILGRLKEVTLRLIPLSAAVYAGSSLPSCKEDTRASRAPSPQCSSSKTHARIPSLMDLVVPLDTAYTCVRNAP